MIIGFQTLPLKPHYSLYTDVHLNESLIKIKSFVNLITETPV